MKLQLNVRSQRLNPATSPELVIKKLNPFTHSTILSVFESQPRFQKRLTLPARSRLSPSLFVY